jgi:uncharacterized protein with FMN-binding domain
MSNKNSHGRQQPIDPLLAQRLNELGSRRAGAPLPPPPPTASPVAGKAAGATPSSKSSRTAPAGGNPRTAAARAASGSGGNPRTAAARAAGGGSNVPTAPRAGRRVKPARSAKLSALAISVASTATLAVLFAHQDSTTDSVVLTGGTEAGGANTVAPASSTAPTTTAPASGAGPTVATTAPATTAPAPKAAGIKNGTYTGGVSQNRWGNVQVAAVYKGGKMVDVQVLQYPDSHNRSVAINQYALPILINDSLGSQSANVNNISGATYTSYSYAQSLQSAIDAAKSASGVTG